MKVKLLNYTPEPEKTVACAARLCYSKAQIDTLWEETKDISRFLNKIISAHHYSVLEHISFTFGIEGISRACSHQLVRHRVASYSQQSQRYVAKDYQYVIPPSIGRNQKIKKEFEQKLNEIQDFYNRMRTQGIPVEDARYILPNAAQTQIIVTMNARELLHFFSLRCCLRAQWEIRTLANKMLREVKKVAPLIFATAGPACFSGPCPEEKPCKNPPRPK